MRPLEEAGDPAWYVGPPSCSYAYIYYILNYTYAICYTHTHKDAQIHTEYCIYLHTDPITIILFRNVAIIIKIKVFWSFYFGVGVERKQVQVKLKIYFRNKCHNNNKSYTSRIDDKGRGGG